MVMWKIHQFFVCKLRAHHYVKSKGVLNLDNTLGALNLDTSPDSSKPWSDKHFKVAKVYDGYLDLKEIADALSINRSRGVPSTLHVLV
jgi:hypothetical protein